MSDPDKPMQSNSQPGAAQPGTGGQREADQRDVGQRDVGQRDTAQRDTAQRDASLEALVGQLARNQPLRRAPDSLERRVLGQLARRHSNVPWWKKGFSDWPMAARASFLLASVGFVWLAVAGFLSVTSYLGAGEIAGTALSWVRVGSNAASLMISAGTFVLHAIPPAWLYAAAVVAFVSYAMLFGLGTVAYRTLYVER